MAGKLRIRGRVLVGIVLFAAFHFAVMTIAIVSYLGMYHSRWLTDAPQSLLERFTLSSLTVLVFPSYELSMLVGPRNDVFYWLACLVGSAVWGTALYVGFLKARKHGLSGSFSLRTMFVVTTMVAVVLALGVWMGP